MRVNGMEDLDVPDGYLLAEITESKYGVVSLWQSPDGTNRFWTFEGPIRAALEEFAKRHGVDFGTAARAFGETGFDWMAR